MGAQRRMAATKGAILSLLLDAYQKRDRIAMVAFKGDNAFVVLPPTDSIDLGKSSLETLPTGGKTPLSAGLQTALNLVKQENRKGSRNKSLMIIISDGRANVSSSSGSNAFTEAIQICEEIRSSGIQSIIIDTETGLSDLAKCGSLLTSLMVSIIRWKSCRRIILRELWGVLIKCFFNLSTIIPSCYAFPHPPSAPSPVNGR
jgi:magnesium chelatase subunit D